MTKPDEAILLDYAAAFGATRPTGIDRSAPVLADHRVTIRAPRTQAWKLLTEIADWPRWQSDIQEGSLVSWLRQLKDAAESAGAFD